MEKLPMCRICLVANVRTLVVNKNLQEVYEKLTDIPFVTEDRKPMLACFYCCAKLKQCYRLLRQCLQAEKLFAQVKNEDYKVHNSSTQEIILISFKPNTLINLNHFRSNKFFSGLIKSPTENISIVDVVQTENIVVKEEVPAVWERLDDIIQPKEEFQSGELEPENVDNCCLDVADTPPHCTESDLEEDLLLMEFKTEVVEQAVSKNKQRACELKKATVAKKPKLDTRRTKLEDALTAEQTTNEKSDSKVIRINHQRTSKPGTYFKEPYKCDQRSFNPVKKIIQHTRTQIGKKPYKCDVCQHSFSKKCNLTDHIRKHTGEKPYKCDICQRSFSTKSNLSKHNIQIHIGEKPYKCNVCQRSFSLKSNLSRHIVIHTGEKPYKCDTCQCSFRLHDTLKIHIRLHTGEKPFKCVVCQRSFCHKSALTSHIRTHTDEKPYKCDICQCSFRQNAALKNHIRRHTGEKPYMCDICQRTFIKKHGLTNHVRIHTGEKPFKCDICQCSFRLRGTFTSHIRTHSRKPF